MPYILKNSTGLIIKESFENSIEENDEWTFEPKEAYLFANEANAQRFRRHYNLTECEIVYYSAKGWEHPRNIRGASKPVLTPFQINS